MLNINEGGALAANQISISNFRLSTAHGGQSVNIHETVFWITFPEGREGRRSSEEKNEKDKRVLLGGKGPNVLTAHSSQLTALFPNHTPIFLVEVFF